MGISHLKVKHRPHKRTDASLETRALCNLYQAPAMGAVVDSLAPLPISWDTSCLNATLLDIYLIAPAASIARIHLYTNVHNVPASSSNSTGTYTAQLMPRWWNATASEQLTISIVPHDQPPFTSAFAAGPIFTATYQAPASGSPVPAVADTSVFSPGVTDVSAALATNKSLLTPGQKAAAALLPLLFIFGLAGYGYIRWKRAKEAGKRKEWTEKVDSRMSTISADWKSVSAAGANAAVRSSIAASRASMALARQSGVNAFSVSESAIGSIEAPGARRTGVGLRHPATGGAAAAGSTERVSRVSFAPDTRPSSSGRISFADTLHPRPSGESRRTTSRAFHTSIYNADDDEDAVPPVPALPAVASLKTGRYEKDLGRKGSMDDDEGSFSPRQREGALALTPEDIRARITANKEKDGFAADVMPALSMMRTGDAANDDYLLPPSPPPPAAVSTTTTTGSTTTTTTTQAPTMSSSAMPMPSANVMSPDDMLRAYAERKKAAAAAAASQQAAMTMTMTPERVMSPVMTRTDSPSSGKHLSFGLGLGGLGLGRKKSIVGTPISYPIPVATGADTGMRVLYTQQETATYNVHTGAITTSSSSTTTTAVGHGSSNSTSEASTVYGQNAVSAAYTASEYSAGERYTQDYTHAQTQQYAFGHHPNGSIGVGVSAYGGAQYAIGDEEDEGYTEGNMAGRGAGMGRGV